jgi:hypothetical protein
MAVTGTTTFTVTRNQIIEAALRGLSVLEEGGQPSATAVENASFALNLIMKKWQTHGIKLWTIGDVNLPLVAGQTSYNIGPAGSASTIDLVTNKPLRVLQAYLRNNSVSPAVDIPMQLISEQEYIILGSKFSQGTTNSVFYKPYVNYGTVRVFLTPDTNTATNYTLKLNVQRPIYDVNNPNDNFDFPSEWFLALKWALMAELASDYDKTLQDKNYYDQKAMLCQKDIEDWDIEHSSTFFQPDVRTGFNRNFR